MAAQLRESGRHSRRQNYQQGSPGQKCRAALFPGTKHSRQSFVQTDQDE
jgi:hypothetical protein